MKHSLPPRSRMLLRVWAGKVENYILPEDEALEVAKLLRLLADGKTVFEILGIQRVKNRPKSYMVEQRIRDVVILQRTRSEGGEGLGVGQAISKVAARKPHIAEKSLINGSGATSISSSQSNSTGTFFSFWLNFRE